MPSEYIICILRDTSSFLMKLTFFYCSITGRNGTVNIEHCLCCATLVMDVQTTFHLSINGNKVEAYVLFGLLSSLGRLPFKE